MRTLSQAQLEREQRGVDLLDQTISDTLDRIGLSEEKVAELAVGPAAREKLKGILARLARNKRPFGQCKRDLAKHHPEMTDEQTDKICGRLKSIVKGTGRAKALSASGDACALLDKDTITLLEAADDEAIAAFDTEEASV